MWIPFFILLSFLVKCCRVNFFFLRFIYYFVLSDTCLDLQFIFHPLLVKNSHRLPFMFMSFRRHYNARKYRSRHLCCIKQQRTNALWSRGQSMHCCVTIFNTSECWLLHFDYINNLSVLHDSVALEKLSAWWWNVSGMLTYLVFPAYLCKMLRYSNCDCILSRNGSDVLRSRLYFPALQSHFMCQNTMGFIIQWMLQSIRLKIKLCKRVSLLLDHLCKANHKKFCSHLYDDSFLSDFLSTEWYLTLKMICGKCYYQCYFVDLNPVRLSDGVVDFRRITVRWTEFPWMTST